METRGWEGILGVVEPSPPGYGRELVYKKTESPLSPFSLYGPTTARTEEKTHA